MFEEETEVKTEKEKDSKSTTSELLLNVQAEEHSSGENPDVMDSPSAVQSMSSHGDNSVLDLTGMPVEDTVPISSPFHGRPEQEDISDQGVDCKDFLNEEIGDTEETPIFSCVPGHQDPVPQSVDEITPVAYQGVSVERNIQMEPIDHAEEDFEITPLLHKHDTVREPVQQKVKHGGDDSREINRNPVDAAPLENPFQLGSEDNQCPEDIDEKKKRTILISDHEEDEEPPVPPFDPDFDLEGIVWEYNVFQRDSFKWGKLKTHKCGVEDCSKKSLWFFRSFNKSKESWAKSGPVYFTRLRNYSRQWNLKRADVEMKIEKMKETEFSRVKAALIQQYNVGRFRELRNQGISEMERLLESTDESENSSQYLSWENNSSGLDSLLAIIPHIMREAKKDSLFFTPKNKEAESGYYSNPFFILIGALHFVSKATPQQQKTFSVYIRQLCEDLFKYEFPKKEYVLWRREANFNGACFWDLFSGFLTPFLRMDMNVFPKPFRVKDKLRDLPSLGEQFLKMCRDNRNVFQSGLHLMHIVMECDEEEQKKLRNLLLNTSWLHVEGRRTGRIIFIYGVDESEFHFICAKVAYRGSESNVFLYDRTRNRGKFVCKNRLELVGEGGEILCHGLVIGFLATETATED